ncbi:hypothetical protein HX776_22290 [Pseudomonas agarici]|nr:hypothetical protein [Pseudomonas agarici]NWC11524.1 hypothetical protein [Pseudomonas agarici]
MIGPTQGVETIISGAFFIVTTALSLRARHNDFIDSPNAFGSTGSFE